VSPAALEAVRTALGTLPRRRDLLIEHLHRLQDAHGGLRPDHLAALAAELRLAATEVYEVATFYSHFDVLPEGAAPPPLAVRVCGSPSCALAGGDALRDALASRYRETIRVVEAPCIGRCDGAPAAIVGQVGVSDATVERVAEMIRLGQTRPSAPEADRLGEAVAGGAYATLAAVESGRLAPEAVIEAIERAGLRGLGGAGFRSAQKWRLVRQEPGPRLLAVNADEGEPGTFKDRHYLEADPHRVLEGMLVAAHCVGAEGIYIYLRDEYGQVRVALAREIRALEESGRVAPGRIALRRGAGAYICGEETAMLESLEGKRGYPRHKPPFPTQSGLFGRPTLIHNVETLYWVRDILERGPGWLADAGRNGRHGLRSFSVSGRVKEPGVKLAPAGITVRELIDEFCGGMREGHTFAAYLPGGASGGILPAHLGDVPLDFGTLEPYGCFIGSAAVVVLSDRDDPRAVARNLLRFFEHESCGQCTPCRLGTEKGTALVAADAWDEAVLTELSTAMRDASICGLGQAAMNPVLSVLRFFPERRP
jgi:formate dehydrogenase